MNNVYRKTNNSYKTLNTATLLPSGTVESGSWGLSDGNIVDNLLLSLRTELPAHGERSLSTHDLWTLSWQSASQRNCNIITVTH